MVLFLGDLLENGIAQSAEFGAGSLLPFLLALAVALVAAKIANAIVKRAAKSMAGRTKTRLDDFLLEALDLPLTIFFMGAGIYAAALLAGLSALPLFGFAAKEFVILAGAYAVYQAFSALLRWYVEEAAAARNLPLADLQSTLRRVGALFIFSIAVIMALDTADIEVSPLIASLGIAGLAVALAFQDTLGNFFAGITISADRPVREGDYVQVEGGYEGYVHKIGWRSTQIRALANNIVVVPNSKLAASIITNYYAPDKALAVLVPVSVAYGSDLKRVERVTCEVASEAQKKVKGATRDFKPFIRYGAFGDSGISFSVILRANEYVDRYLLTHEFIKALHARYAKEGIEIPYPKRHVYVENLGKRRGMK